MTDFMERIEDTMKKALVMKKHMKAKGITKAKAKCPYCAGYWHGRLTGPKQHLHMGCDGDCGAMMME